MRESKGKLGKGRESRRRGVRDNKGRRSRGNSVSEVRGNERMGRESRRRNGKLGEEN